MNVVLNKVIEILIGSSQLPRSEKKKKIRPKNSKRGGNGEETEGRRGRGRGWQNREKTCRKDKGQNTGEPSRKDDTATNLIN